MNDKKVTPDLEKPDFRKLAWELWEQDCKTNQSSVNPHAFVYGAKCIGKELWTNYVEPLQKELLELREKDNCNQCTFVNSKQEIAEANKKIEWLKEVIIGNRTNEAPF